MPPSGYIRRHQLLIRSDPNPSEGPPADRKGWEHALLLVAGLADLLLIPLPNVAVLACKSTAR